MVRDNRVNHDTTKEAKPASVLPATSSVENASGKGYAISYFAVAIFIYSFLK